MEKLRVGILFGGRSGEHEVSLLSAASVLNAIDKEKYDVVPIGITKDGRWLTAEHAEHLLQGKLMLEPRNLRAGDPETTPSAAVLARGESVVVPPEPVHRQSGLVPFQTDAAMMRRASDRAINVDVIFPVLHGTFGEDGTIQGLLELADIPYVGAGVLGSAAGMDKDIMKSLFIAAGIPIVKHVTLLRSMWEKEPKKVAKLVKRAKKKPPAAPINLNTASSEELQQVPGIGPVTAEKILQMRKSYGAFKSVDDLSAIRGIGPKRLEKMRKYLTVGKATSAAKPANAPKPATPPKPSTAPADPPCASS